jgi:hypothetical protein
VSATGELQPVGKAELEFLSRIRDVILFCRDAAGHPVGYPMRTAACVEEALVFTTYRKSAKVAHIERDPGVCVLATEPVEELGDPGEPPRRRVRWMSVNGEARVVLPTDNQIQEVFGTQSGGDTETRVPVGMSDHVRSRLRDGKRVLVYVQGLRSNGVHDGEILGLR